MNLADYKNIWVFIETECGKPKNVGFELINAAKPLAQEKGCELIAVVIGKDIEGVAKDAICYGADSAIIVDGPEYEYYTTDAFAKALVALVEKYKPETLMIGATNNGRDLGPRVSCRLKTGLTADCTAIAIDEETGNVAWTRPTFGGNLMATIMCPENRPQMGTVRPAVFKKGAYDEAKTGEIVKEEITVAAANAGKHVFCEKPMAMNEDECDEMINAAKENNVKLQIGFMRRFDESFQEAKRMIEAGEIGEVVSVKSHTRGPSKPKEWMYDISISNGPLGEVCSHDIDTVRWFSGSEISSLYAVGGNYRNKEIADKYPDFYDNVIMSVEFENGMQGVVEGAQYVQYGYDARVEILGTEGVISLGDIHEKKVITCTKNHDVKRPTMHSWTYLFKDAYVAEDTAFVRAILDDTEVKATGHDGKMAVKIVRIGNESLKEKMIKKL